MCARREPHAARAADNHHLFTFVSFHVYSPRLVCVALLIYELFSMIMRCRGYGQDLFELVSSKYRRNPMDDQVVRNRQLILVTATISPRPALLQDAALKDAGLDKSTPETLTTACHAASWLARSWRCGWRCTSIGPENFPLAEAKIALRRRFRTPTPEGIGWLRSPASDSCQECGSRLG